MRINGIEVRGDFDPDYDRPALGKYFLVYRRSTNRPDKGWYTLQSAPGRTNRSHEERLSGYLGETDNVYAQAQGAVEVYLDKAGCLRARQIDAQALYDEVSPNSEVKP